MSRNAIEKFIPTTKAIASECRVRELKNAIPDSRISMLSAVSSSLASVSRVSNLAAELLGEHSVSDGEYLAERGSAVNRSPSRA